MRALNDRLGAWHRELSKRWLAGIAVLFGFTANLDTVLGWFNLSESGVASFIGRVDWRTWVVLWLCFSMIVVLEALFAAASERDSARGALEGRKRSQEFSDRMSDHHEHGIHELLNKPPGPRAQDFEEWRLREKDWNESILKDMRAHHCSTQEIRHVQTLGLFPMFNLHPDPKISLLLTMVVTRCQRIADIAAKYGE